MTIRQEFQTELAALIKELQPTIGDEYRAYDDSDSDTPSMLLTIGVDENGWSYQTGDTSFTGRAYGYASWGQVAIDREEDPQTLARELIEDLESNADDSARFFFDEENAA